MPSLGWCSKKLKRELSEYLLRQLTCVGKWDVFVDFENCSNKRMINLGGAVGAPKNQYLLCSKTDAADTRCDD
jgi:hypothetical protein